MFATGKFFLGQNQQYHTSGETRIYRSSDFSFWACILGSASHPIDPHTLSPPGYCVSDCLSRDHRCTRRGTYPPACFQQVPERIQQGFPWLFFVSLRKRSKKRYFPLQVLSLFSIAFSAWLGEQSVDIEDIYPAIHLLMNASVQIFFKNRVS